MKILLPATGSVDWRVAMSALAHQRPLEPFANVLVDFVAAFSTRIATDRAMRSHPDAIALAHWMRRAHLLAMKQELAGGAGRPVRAARGFVIHFAPSNVDTLFVYSWFLALLAGNANVVRVSSDRLERVAPLLDAMNELLARPQFEEIRARNAVVTFAHEEDVTGFLSDRCHVRVIWGGDETVAALRSVPLAPLATELAFADRFSLAVFRAGALIEADDAATSKLAENFCNDAFVFDQRACSSPRLVVWVGDDASTRSAQSRFWTAVGVVMRRRGVAYPPVVAMDRASAVFALAASGAVAGLSGPLTGLPTRVTLASAATPAFRTLHCGGGLFFELRADDLPGVASHVTERDQTLIHFGFTSAELTRLAASLPSRAIDRMVPVGRALEFSHVWDGVNLLDAFTRAIDLAE